MRILATVMACGIFLALCDNAARSDTDECRDALDHYNAASTLHSAQDDFEFAVSEYQDKCSN